MIGFFDLPQTQKERHAVRMEGAVSGEERCVTTLTTAARRLGQNKQLYVCLENEL